MAVEVAGVEVSNPDKVLFPASDRGPAVTKRDLAEYYAAVADVMLPHLRGRPVNMQRFPDGIEADAFYEKKVPSHFPDWFATVEVGTGDGPQRQVMVEDARSLVHLAQQACITPHTWLSRDAALDTPDQLVFDLDPSVEDLAGVRRATRLVGELLDDLGLTSYVKTTGSRGYHVLVPLRPDGDFDEVRGFARQVAEVLVAREPDLLTLEQRKDKRGRRVFVDVLRNAYAQTTVPPYAVRGRPGAPVSTPIEWDELSRVEPDQHTIVSIRRRLAQRDDPWAGVRRHAQGLGRARSKVGHL
ncbi:non-homologous end-joining DNA ligase [Nocardioides sp. MAHUQ-72]|uniref:non-homologous end-joining DNA ligase n=1 Tax=unclassified Nocardioides TaxID=2615069 RepID=UPI00361B7442